MRLRNAIAERRTLQRTMPRSWWLRNIRYTVFMLRELSSVLIFLFAVLYLVQFALLAAGPETYDDYRRLMRTPGWIVLHVFILIFAIIHTLTWLVLTATVNPLRLGRRDAPRWLMWLMGFTVWIAVSVGIGWVMLEG